MVNCLKNPVRPKFLKQILNLGIREEEFLLKATQFYISSEKTKEAISLLLSHQKKEGTSLRVAKLLFALFLSSEQPDKAYAQFRRLEELGSLDDTHYLFIKLFFII